MHSNVYICRTLFTGIIFTEHLIDYHITETQKVIYPNTALKYCKHSIYQITHKIKIDIAQYIIENILFSN